MKTLRTIKHSLATILFIGLVFPLSIQAGQMPDTGCTKRPLTEFLDAQGSTSLFFPPVSDMLAWTDLNFVNFAVVDYAGLMNDYLDGEVGTKVNGRVLECVDNDGTVTVKVVLSTQKALAFAQSVEDLFASEFDFLNTPTIFGAKAQDVASGAEPAIGPASLSATFTITNPGDPIPDLRIMYQEDIANHLPATIDFRSTTVGALSDGTKAIMKIQQVGATNEAGELVFTREIVDIK